MSIRTNYTGNTETQRKIDQLYELYSLASVDGDFRDAARYMQRIKELERNSQN